MASVAVVAIPSEDDYVWKLSSEKVPHITILFLGEMPVPNLGKIAGFVQHAASQSLSRFALDVDKRGTLGDKDADVLFFEKSKWSGYVDLATFRSNLLQDSNIRVAYESTDQFPEWVPHLTMGYPETPAKEDTRDHPGIYYVSFDKIALWFGDYSGVEFPLSRRDPLLEEASMVNSVESRVDLGRRNIGELLHYGVKGMKWGVRRDRSSRVTVAAKGKRLKTSGGVGRKPSEDAKRTAVIGQIAKKSGYKALSNAELRAYTERLALESRARSLDSEKNVRAVNFVKAVLREYGKVKKARK